MSQETLAPREQESADSGVEATQTDASKEAVTDEKPASKKYRVKGDGFDEEVDEATLIKGYQLERTANRRVEDASKLYKNVKPYIPLIQALQKGDLKVLKDLGVPKEALRKFSEEELLAYIEEQEMNPDQRARLEAERERDKVVAERDDGLKKAAKKDSEAAAQKAAQELDSDMRSALEGAKIPLKGNYLLVRRIAEDMYGQIEAGKKPSAKESLTKVQKSLQEDFGEHATREFARDPDAFISSLPAGIADGIRKRSLKEVQAQLPIGNRVDTDLTQKPRKDSSFVSYMKEEMQKLAKSGR